MVIPFRPRSSPLPVLAVVLQGFDEGGGVATSCLNQIHILLGEYRVILITDRGSSVPRALPADVQVRRLPVHPLRWLRRFAHVPRQCLFLLAVRRVLLGPGFRDVEAVIFHSHPAAALLTPPFRRRGIKSLMVVHGDIFDRPVGTYDARLTAWYRWATPRAYRRVDAILSLSPAMVELARRWTDDRIPIHLVPNSIDPAAIGLDLGPTANAAATSAVNGSGPGPTVSKGVPDALPTREPQDELLFVGRIEPLKGIDVLLHALALLLASGRQLQLRCIGSVNPVYRPLFEQRLNALGLRESVQLSGPQPRNRLGGFYRRCQLLVVPSRSEPQATVILEGMAAGCAIVASDVGGNRMMLESEHSGLLFPRDDVQSLASCLERLLDDPALRQRLGGQARRRFYRDFCRQAVAPRLLEAVAATLGSVENHAQCPDVSVGCMR